MKEGAEETMELIFASFQMGRSPSHLYPGLAHANYARARLGCLVVRNGEFSQIPSELGIS